MAATVMIVEFGDSHHNSSLEENSEAFFVEFFEQMQKLTDQYVSYDFLAKNNRYKNTN